MAKNGWRTGSLKTEVMKEMKIQSVRRTTHVNMKKRIMARIIFTTVTNVTAILFLILQGMI